MSSRLGRLALAATAVALLCGFASDGGWLKRVPARYEERRNPYAGQPTAIAGGRELYLQHCASCHGEGALGRGRRPSLHSQRVRQATDGEIYWLLENGSLAHGMPSWSRLPEQQRWQVIAYLRSLPPVPAE
ncbi:MAG: c-type cytochrome [Acidobacteriaceae bacterium]